MRQKIGKICMLLGVLLLLGALAVFCYNKWDENRADKASQEVLGELEEVLPEEPEAEQEELRIAVPISDPEQAMTETEIDGYKYIGYVSIPSIELELPVMSQWSYAGLKIAPGRYTGTTYADNLVVCGHNYAKHFSPIKWLAVGTEVNFVDMDGLTWSYTVSKVETIQPTQIEKMTTATENDDWDLTLFTCTTGGRARYALRCVRSGDPTRPATEEEIAAAENGGELQNEQPVTASAEVDAA